MQTPDNSLQCGARVKDRGNRPRRATFRSLRAGTIPRSNPAKSGLYGFSDCLLKPAAGAHAKITQHTAKVQGVTRDNTTGGRRRPKGPR